MPTAGQKDAYELLLDAIDWGAHGLHNVCRRADGSSD
jgi:hypothetical protein